MSSTVLVAFAVVALIGVVTPGLDTMVTLRHALIGGWRAGLAAVAGISAGCCVWGAASALGLAALLNASDVGYRVVQLLGATYLIWLGGTALLRTLRRGRPNTVSGVPVAGRGTAAALRIGLVTNLLNPKVGVFYISLLPQFLPAGPTATGWAALLVVMHVTIGMVWLGGLVVLTSKAARLLLGERVREWLDRVTAGVLLGLGAALIVNATR